MERMNWLSRLASRGPGHRVPQGASLQTPVMADPETCLMVFKNHWSQVGVYKPKGLVYWLPAPCLCVLSPSHLVTLSS